MTSSALSSRSVPVRAAGTKQLPHSMSSMNVILPYVEACVASIVGSLLTISNFSLVEPPSAIPVGWYRYVQPEGATYFYNPLLRVVTPSDVCLPNFLELIMTAFESITAMMEQKEKELNLSSEIYIELRGSLSQPQCCYYLIDHTCRVPFWVADITVDAIGLEPFSSEEHLKSLLNQEYWLHVEHFPMHNAMYPLKAEDELICILADSSVSPGPSTPYSMNEANDFNIAVLALRSLMINTPHDGYRCCTVARLWLLIARTRHINTYGLWMPRLDRLQNLGLRDNDRVSLLQRLSSTSELGTPRSTLETCLRWARQCSWLVLSTINQQDLGRSEQLTSLMSYCGKWAFVLLSFFVWGVNISISLFATESDIFAHLKTISSALPRIIVISLLLLCELHNENQLPGANVIIGYTAHVENYDYNQRPAPAALAPQGSIKAILTVSVATGLVLLDSLPLRTLYPIILCGALPLFGILATVLFFG
ncbi:hypothetical protein FRC03_010718 [Tulasnella sp. 419]|nr:hypothetical protein FRC03_010718 [Tulasnella sp. 419]